MFNGLKQFNQGGHSLMCMALALAGGVFWSVGSYGIDINPARCEKDSLEQNQTEGRNKWFKKHKPELYELIFSEGSEFFMNKQKFDRRLYVTVEY